MVTVSEIKTEVLQSNLFETPSEMVKVWKQPTVVLFQNRCSYLGLLTSSFVYFNLLRKQILSSMFV